MARSKAVPKDAFVTLSKLENNLFIPALVLGTFINYFTVEKIGTAWKLFAGSSALTVIVILLSLLCARFCVKDSYERRICAYGLSFSNFAYVGNAVISALYPQLFMEYLIFILPIWMIVFLWGAPVLLLSDGIQKPTWAQRLKNFANPMLVCTLIGMAIGLLGFPVPEFINSAITSAGNCMSPMAMLLTGIAVAQFDMKALFKRKSIYLISALRLVVFPLLFLALMQVIPFSKTFAICAVCNLAMPIGMNTIIIPGAAGKDTKLATGMTLVSHIFSAVTIPVVFMVLMWLL